MIDLSIIITILNGEKHIADCLSCIPEKTKISLEIILVNDGSSDKTLSLLEQAAKIDSRIRIISFYNNKGISVARNTALDASMGAYIYFADIDDTFDFSGIERLFEMAVKDELDVAIGYRREYIEAKETYLPYNIKTKDSGVLSGDNFFLLSDHWGWFFS